MPILANAKKALRVSLRKTEVNRRLKSQLKTALRLVKKSPETDALATAYSKIDKAVKSNIIHPNKAARLKRQVAREVAAATKS